MAIAAHTHLETLLADLHVLGQDTKALVAGLGEAQLRWRPAPEQWGIADCYEHLILSNDLYFPRLREVLAAAVRTTTPGVYRPRLFGRLFIWSVGPRNRMRVKTSPSLVPPPAAADAPQRFLAQQDTLAALIEAARHVDLQQVRVVSPVDARFTFTLGECLHFLVAHQQRHVAQARRVRDAPGFPAA
jgi:hypothetical protein